MLKHIRNNIFIIIRITLILSVAINIARLIAIWATNFQGNKTELLTVHEKLIEYIFFALITFILSFGSTLIEKRQKIDIPDILEIVIVLFIYAGMYLSDRFDLYYRFFWWDDLLHTFSGVILGFVGFIVIYKINHKFSMDINPLLVALFSFTFAVTLGVIWEILEFSCDVLIGTAHQKWDLPDTEILIGKVYQGTGLRDTMSDLIVDSIGAFITSVITYYMYKNKKKKTLEEMGKIIA